MYKYRLGLGATCCTEAQLTFVLWYEETYQKFENRSEIVVIFSAKQRIYEINLEQSLIPWPVFKFEWLSIKTFLTKHFFLLTNYNDPNLFQFHLPFLNLMPYALKNVSPVHNFIKKRVTSSIVDMVMVANCYKLSLVRVLNFQSVPSKSGVFLYIFKKLVLTPWTNSLREIEVSS